MLSRVIIPANTVYYYEIVYSFNNLPDVNQNADRGRTFSAKLEVKASQ